MLSQKQMDVIQAFEDCVDKARSLFGKKVPRMELCLDLRGKAAGMCCWTVGDLTKFKIRLNIDLIERDGINGGMRDTIPHEIAHAICVATNSDEGHGYMWQLCCLQLGGNGKRTYDDNEIVYAKGSTYEYTATCGTKVRVSQVLHKRIQQGQDRILRSTRGRVTKDCSWSIVA